MKRKVWVELLFFGLGLLSAGLLGSEFFSSHGFLNMYCIREFAEKKLDVLHLFGNILWTRGKQFAVLWICFLSSWRSVFYDFGKFFLSFFAGLFVMICVGMMGSKGLLFSLVSVVPHGLIYIVLMLMIYDLKPEYAYEQHKKGQHLLKLLMVCFVFFVACAIETFLGSFMIQKILRF